MTVAELIEFLKKQPQDLRVAFKIYSEQCLLDEESITIESHCPARSDGWIQNMRPDIEHESYLMFPGN